MEAVPFAMATASGGCGGNGRFIQWTTRGTLVQLTNYKVSGQAKDVSNIAHGAGGRRHGGRVGLMGCSSHYPSRGRNKVGNKILQPLPHGRPGRRPKGEMC